MKCLTPRLSQEELELMYGALLEDMRVEFPHFAVIRKDEDPKQQFIGKFLTLVTFGAQNSYVTSYQTTIGQKVYVTADWDQIPVSRRLSTMRHERVHMQQFRKYTFVGMSLLYLFVPLPMGLAWFRAQFEKEAYEVSIRSDHEIWGPDKVHNPKYEERLLSQFTSGAYGWMWPFRKGLERWYNSILADL